MSRPVLVDLSCLCEAHTDAALDYIYKAAADDPPGESIWDEHPNPFIRHLIELFTKRGLDRVGGISGEMRRWLSGDMHLSTERPPRPPAAMARWSPAELSLTRLYLESLPRDKFTVDDWLMVVDYLVQRYLPEGDLRSEAQWLSTRSALMGRVQRALETTTEANADRILAALPATAGEARIQWGLTPRQQAVIDYGNKRCAENVVAVSDALRRRMRSLIVDFSEAEYLGDRVRASESLQGRLLDAFGTANRDWRRIAVTEAGENANQGLIASLSPGARVKRVERYRGVCAFCRSIDGKTFTVVAPDAPTKNGETEVWAGKTNIGRSASPRRRIGGVLVEREPHELYHPAAGLQHPNCRGTWIPIQEATRRGDPAFEEWMAKVLKR